MKNGWQIKSLGEVAEFITTGKTPSTKVSDYFGGQILWFTPSDIGISKYLNLSERTLTHKAILEGKAVLFPKDTLLITCIGNIGRVGILQNDGSSNQQITGIKFNSNIDVNYAYYWFRKNSHHLIYRANKAIVPILNNSQLREIKIEQPPLPIQKQIAEILKKADQTKQKRQNANRLTEQFLQSAFIEMFGDPVKNPKGWGSEKFENLGKLARGKSKHRPRNAPFLLGGKYPLIQTGEIVNSFIYIKNYTQTYSEEGLKQSRIWPKGTLCISIAANIGFTAILTFEACFPDSIVGFTPNEKVLSEYIHFYFGFIQKKLEEDAPQSAQKNINLEILNNLGISVPPLPLQQQFAAIVEKVEVLKKKQKESEKELENLFSSLMQKAFKGELVS